MTTTWRVDPFELPLREAFGTARDTLTERAGYLVSVTRDGITGWGEACPYPAAGTERRGDCEAALDLAVRREDPLAHPALRVSPAARHGMVGALMDLACREAGTSLATGLAQGRAVRRQVPVNGVIPGLSNAAEEAVRLVNEGFTVIKIKGNADPDVTVERVARVRAVIPSGVRLRVDANGAWDRVEARRAMTALGGLGVEYVEQPLDPRDMDGLGRLRGLGPMIALDESVGSVHDAKRAIDAGACDVLVLKPMVLGGPDRVMEVATLAGDAGVPIVITTTIDGCVARAHALHAAAAVPGYLWPCGLDTGRLLYSDLVKGANVPTGPVLDVPDSPGMGFEVPDDA